MSLSDSFNSEYVARMANNNVLDISYASHNIGSIYMSVDFMSRTLVTGRSGSATSLAVTPFSQLDREMLVAMRDKLVELGGKPPALPAEAPAAPRQQKGLNP